MNPTPKPNITLTAPNCPKKHTLRTAEDIRLRFGYGGARFPGSKDLYAAADKIEAWAAEWDWSDVGDS